MGFKIVKLKKDKPDPDRKKTKTVRRTATTSSFDKGAVTKGGKFASMSNTDIKRRSKKVVNQQIKEHQGFTTMKDAKKVANRDLARMNRASGVAARKAQKRTKKQS
tara:strand:- start:983 stop:1300 length:318 start_codon:yes stop_codon:yes gene_type:complete